MDTIKIGITVGDINGIGLEVILKTLSNNLVYKNFAPIIYGSPKIVSYHKNIINLPDLHINQVKTPDQAQQGVINLITCWQESVNISLGQASAEAGKYALISLTEATKDLKAGDIHGIVTAPVDKQVIHNEQFPFIGHTEYFAKEFNSPTVMLMTSPNVSVGMVTDHIPLKDVSRSLSKDLIIEKIKILHKTLRRDFGYEKGKIAVLGLNPHAGDKGLIGDEELSIIRPAIVECKNQGIFVFGPYSADGFFGSAQFKKFEAVLALYHDQGLIPFKTIAFSEGVNFTAGQPEVRTSPDHGVGYDTAGQNVADETSFRHALQMAFDVVRNRRSYDEAHNNPIAKRAKNFEDEVLKDEN